MDDVIVIGAGPAGNNTAYRLASLGYGVTVVDWRKKVGDKLCSGIVGRECIQRFPSSQSQVFRDARLAKVISPEGKVVEFARPDVQAHVLDRAAYVASFADKARQAGANFLLGPRVTDVSLDGGHPSIQIADETGRRTLRARALVLASGFGSDLTSQIGLGKVGDFVTGVQAEVSTSHVDEIHIYYGRGIAPGFFAWLVPTSEGRALVGLLARRSGQTYLDRLILKLQSEGKITRITKAPARWGIPLRPLPRTFGAGMLVVGDAAGQVKPTTGGGIYYALLASEIASDNLHRAFCRNDLSASQLSNYEKEWKALLARELEIGYSARRLFEVLTDCQIDSLVNTIASNGIYTELIDSQFLSFDWHSSAITKVTSHPLLFKALSFINPLLASLASHT